MKNEKRDCKFCPMRKVLDEIFKPKTKCTHYLSLGGGSDREYETLHICGLCEHEEKCDIPGHRYSDEWAFPKYCILDVIQEYIKEQRCKDVDDDHHWCKAEDRWCNDDEYIDEDEDIELPLYKGTYEALFNCH